MQFIAVNGDFESIFSALQNRFNLDSNNKKHEFVIEKNNVEISKNEDYVPSLVDHEMVTFIICIMFMYTE